MNAGARLALAAAALTGMALAAPAVAQLGGDIHGGGGGGGGSSGPATSMDDGTTCAADVGLAFSGDADTGLYLVDVGVAPGHAIGLCVDGTVAGLFSIGSSPATNSYGNTGLGWQVFEDLDLTGGGTGDDALHNTAIGGECLPNLTTGMQNTCVGNRSCYTMTTATANTCVGQGACNKTTGGYNTAVGQHAMVNVDAANPNVAFGYRVLEGTAGTGAAATGEKNAAFGYFSMHNFSTADYAAIFGYEAGRELTTGDQNTLIGFQAGDSLTTSAGNTFVGYLAGQAMTTQGSANTGVGRTALTSATGTDNAAFGYNAGGGVTSGYSNTMLGHMAGTTVTTGFQNVFIGDDANGAASSTQDAIAIGYGVTAATGIVQIGGTEPTAYRLGTVRASGTVATFRTPGAAGNDTITLPTCDVNNQFAQIAVDDTNDTAAAMLCWCRRGADDTTYAWVSVHDNSTACIDP